MEQVVNKKNEANKFATNALKLTSSKVAVKIVSILAMPIITRMYSPADFGIFQVIISITTVIIAISSLRYEMAIMLPKKDEDATNLVVLSSMIIVFISTITLLIVFFLKDHFAILMGIPELSSYLWTAPIIVLMGGLLHVFQYWSLRIQLYGMVAISGFASNISTSLIKVTIGAFGLASPGGLISATVFGSALGTIVLLGKTFNQTMKHLKQNVTFTQLKILAKRYKEFPLYSTWSGLFNFSSDALPAFFLAYYFTPDVVGFYALGVKVVSSPANMVSDSIAKVFFQKTSQEKHVSGRIDSLVDAIFKRLVALSLLPTLIILLYGQGLFVFLFGAAWSEAGYYIQVFAPWVFFAFISAPLKTLFNVEEKQFEGMKYTLLLFLSSLTILVIGGVIGEVSLTILMLGITKAFFYCLLSFWIFRLVNIPMYRILRHIAECLLFCVPFILVALLSKVFNIIHYYEIAGVMISVVIYLYAVISRDLVLRDLIFDILKKQRSAD